MSHSVIQLTGQMWKFVLAILALVIGSVAPIFPSTGISWTAGTVLAIGGYAFGCAILRCPACGSRWFWDALMRPEWYKPLLTAPACPACDRNFGDA